MSFQELNVVHMQKTENIAVQNQADSGRLPLCVLLTTGGTIASRIDPLTGLAVPVRSARELLQSTPRLASLAEMEVDEVFCIPSPHVGLAHWLALYESVTKALARPEVKGVVISHGTALMEETAWFLDLTINSHKPVILIGAQRNASDPDFDGPFNLYHAVRVCISEQAQGKGVLIMLNQHINAAREVTKTHTFDVQTFHSGEWGYLGNASADRIIFHRTPTRRLHVPLVGTDLPCVEVVSMYAGADGRLVTAAAQHAKGLVIQAVGAGHVNEAMYQPISSAIRQGVKVVIATRIPSGGVRPCYGFAGSSQLLKDAGAVMASDLSAWKARILLMLAISTGMDSIQIQDLFDH